MNALRSALSTETTVTIESSTSKTPDTSSERKKNDKPRHKEGYKIGLRNVNTAFDDIKANAWANFDETVECIVRLNVDPRKPNQAIRGVSTLPYGVGKTIKVGVFARASDAEAALSAGADVVGAEDLISKIQSGDISFDRTIATPEMMPLLAKIGKVPVMYFHFVSDILILLSVDSWSERLNAKP